MLCRALSYETIFSRKKEIFLPFSKHCGGIIWSTVKSSYLLHRQMHSNWGTCRGELLQWDLKTSPNKKRIKYFSLFSLAKKAKGEYACSNKYIKKESRRTRDWQFEVNKNSSTQMKGVSWPFRLENRRLQLQKKVLRGTLWDCLLLLPLWVSSAWAVPDAPVRPVCSTHVGRDPWPQAAGSLLGSPCRQAALS